MEASKAWIGMGSNQGERLQSLQEALRMLDAGGARVLRVSSVYETVPHGFDSDTLFLNAAAEVEWNASAEALLELLLQTEQVLGRVRPAGERYGSRTIDLDLLLFGEEVINISGLIVPHPRMAERRFVLDPLNELIPSYIEPVSGQTIAGLLESCIDENESFIHDKALSINP